MAVLIVLSMVAALGSLGLLSAKVERSLDSATAGIPAFPRSRFGTEAISFGVHFGTWCTLSREMPTRVGASGVGVRVAQAARHGPRSSSYAGISLRRGHDSHGFASAPILISD